MVEPLKLEPLQLEPLKDPRVKDRRIPKAKPLKKAAKIEPTSGAALIGAGC